MSKFKVSVRYYSAVDHKLVWVSKALHSSEEQLKVHLNLDHVKGLNTLDLFRTGQYNTGMRTSNGSFTHECIPVMRTNIMVRDESGNLIKWKHLVK